MGGGGSPEIEMRWRAREGGRACTSLIWKCSGTRHGTQHSPSLLPGPVRMGRRDGKEIVVVGLTWLCLCV